MKNIIYPTEEIYQNEENKYLFQIVSSDNGIDVDRMDYILRDIKMTGLTYGIETHEIMIHSKINNNHIIYKDRCSRSRM